MAEPCWESLLLTLQVLNFETMSFFMPCAQQGFCTRPSSAIQPPKVSSAPSSARQTLLLAQTCDGTIGYLKAIYKNDNDVPVEGCFPAHVLSFLEGDVEEKNGPAGVTTRASVQLCAVRWLYPFREEGGIICFDPSKARDAASLSTIPLCRLAAPGVYAIQNGKVNIMMGKLF